MIECMSFSEFDRRAKEGDSLSVVFIGGSLTWGAGASEPNRTSYRALTGQKLAETYPRAKFMFHDAAIGGTTSLIASFRLERDLLSKKPDLVFLDFALNDELRELDLERATAYECLLRRILLNSGAPVVMMFLPFWEIVEPGYNRELPGRDARLALADRYGTAVAEAITRTREIIESGGITLEKIWPNAPDRTHPGDAGYAIYADVAWRAYQDVVREQRVCRIPPDMTYPDTYMRVERRLLRKACQTVGWRREQPKSDSPVGDFVMSRWLDEVIVANAGATASCLHLTFHGATAFLMGESTPLSGRYNVSIDRGEAVEYDAGDFARRVGGNCYLYQILATGLLPDREHDITIEPLLEDGQELRLESLCVAGG